MVSETGHAISNVQLNENQKGLIELLESACKYNIRRGTICLVGDFQSGKTTIVKHFIMSKFGTLEGYYVNLSLFLLDILKKENPDLRLLSEIKAKARLIMEVAISRLLEESFKFRDLLILDSIEIIYPYNINLTSLANRHAKDGKICIICVPENDKFSFNFSWENCDIIRIE